MNNNIKHIFDYNEVVIISAKDSLKKEIIGKKGIISGKSLKENGSYAYSVSLIGGDGTTWFCEEKELKGTGVFDYEYEF